MTDASLTAEYMRLRDYARLTERLAAEIARDARAHALDAMGRGIDPPDSLPVSTRLVDYARARGGCLLPAWPLRGPDGSVVIEFVEDWGVQLAAWRSILGEPAHDREPMDALARSGERIRIGISNDVLQLFVEDPPPGTYSMVRHHGLMLAAATIWLGPDRAAEWARAHAYAAIGYLGSIGDVPLWEAVGQTERQLDRLLSDPRAREAPEGALAWLESEPSAAATYTRYLGASSLGVAAILAEAPESGVAEWLRRLVLSEHPRPDFARGAVERFAAKALASDRTQN